MATYTKMHPRPNVPRPIENPDEEPPEFDDMPMRISQDEDLTDRQLLLLPPATHGYSLREKKWGKKSSTRRYVSK